MKNNIIKSKSYNFAIRIINLNSHLTNTKREFAISSQLVRSGTAIGALVREAEHAESMPDFIHKLAIALKEANETEYWLQLLKDTGFISKVEHSSIECDIKELLKLLISIINTSKKSRVK
ncbi:MAG: four helix bundle protein [Saprospiraceae bacterium]